MSNLEKRQKMRRNLRVSQISLAIGATVALGSSLYGAITGNWLGDDLSTFGRVASGLFAVTIGYFVITVLHQGCKLDKVLTGDLDRIAITGSALPYDQEKDDE